MKGILIIYILTVSSSYSENKELPADMFYDVVEYWITDSNAYRIKTYSTDLDIHVYQFRIDNLDNGLKLADKNTQDNYGDIIKKRVKLELNGNETKEQLDSILKGNGLEGRFEINEFVFWNPDRREYRTMTEPK